jgi:mono/diheme cytochrome c family protein
LSRLIAAACIAVLCSAIVSAQTPSQEPSPALPLDGPSIFASAGCPQCHGASGQGTTKAPSLRDVSKRKTEEEMRTQIKDGGKTMPPFSEALTDEQITRLIEFLRSKDAWKNTPTAPAHAH